jgi:hypothetical protein
MKTKVRSTVLVALFIAFIISVFVVFALIRNNQTTTVINIILIIILILGVALFSNAMQLLSTSKITQIENEHNQLETEKEINEITEAVTEKINERELDIKKIIPKEKQKIEIFSEDLLKNLSEEISIVQALLYIKDPADMVFKCTGKFAYYADNSPGEFKSGETLPGQAVKNKNIVTISNIPENYMVIASGLGNGKPGYITYVPILLNDEAVGLIEFATFIPISSTMSKNLSQLSEKIADSISKFIKK